MKMKGLNVKKLMKSVNVENVVIGVLVFVLLVLVVVYVRQNNEGFEAQNTDKPELKFYMAPWCGFCQDAKKYVFDEFEKNVDHSDKVKLVTINCDEEKEKCSAAGIEAFPTCIMNGNKFGGDSREPSEVAEFIKSNL